MPGVVVSAKALLNENPNPSRQDVRAWFQTNHNACRCNGYKPIVDAVMDAAKVLRGEMPREALEFAMPADGRIWGTGIRARRRWPRSPARRTTAPTWA